MKSLWAYLAEEYEAYKLLKQRYFSLTNLCELVYCDV